LKKSTELGYFCGKHKFRTNNQYSFNLHIINEHDSEHGYWQLAGSAGWQITLADGKVVKWFGDFRYLPMYSPLTCNCRCMTGYGCWQDPSSCTEPERHKIKTMEEYKKWVDKKWKG